MDQMVRENIFNGIYKNKRVFVTGHTGFKGSWLVLWLQSMGAIVKGYALKPDTKPSHWEMLNLKIESVYNDIRHFDDLESELLNFKPDIVFHLAAQPLVRYSYENPLETYEVNVMGTVKLLEACRRVGSLRAIVNITTDKCYENKEWVYGYRENDPMGGYDPYSSSKGCVEILSASYRNSFWSVDKFGKEHNVLLATCRAGNVIGGGDWSKDRLIPDIIIATTVRKQAKIRNPYAIRPWQHVLEPLSGYLLLGQKLLEGKKEFAESWNLGPGDNGNLTVDEVVKQMTLYWSEIRVEYDQSTQPHEANLLKLDCSKAHTYLKWRPVWDDKVYEKTTLWYKEYYSNNRKIISIDQIHEYIQDAIRKEINWAIF